MRDLYRPIPRPGKGKSHPAKKGGIGWVNRKRNDAADTGVGWIYVLTGMGGRACDLSVMGQTRNHPVNRGMQILSRNRVKYWADIRTIDAHHRSDPPQLWASRSTNRKRDDREIHRLLVDDYFARGGEKEPEIVVVLATVLHLMEIVTGDPPARYPLIPPTELSSNVTHAGIDT